jgi:predicted metal-dependent peptidase
MLTKRWSERVPTACVSLQGINYQLDLCPEFWDKLSSKHRRGLLKHELLHIGFFHITDFKHLTDHDVANIAMD